MIDFIFSFKIFTFIRNVLLAPFNESNFPTKILIFIAIIIFVIEVLILTIVFFPLLLLFNFKKWKIYSSKIKMDLN
jgi:hypothetical protein